MSKTGQTIARRRAEADEFYAAIQPPRATEARWTQFKMCDELESAHLPLAAALVDEVQRASRLPIETKTC